MRDISLSRYCKILVQNIGAHNVVSLFELCYQFNPRVLLSVTPVHLTLFAALNWLLHWENERTQPVQPTVQHDLIPETAAFMIVITLIIIITVSFSGREAKPRGVGTRKTFPSL